MPTTSATLGTNQPLLVALIAAVIVHVVLISVQVSKPEPAQIGKSIAITLVNAPSPQVVEKPQVLAQENQLASGEQMPNIEPVTPPPIPTPKAPPVPNIKPIPKNLTQKVKSAPQVKPVPKQPEKIKPIVKAKPEPLPEPKPMVEPKPKPKVKPEIKPEPKAKPVEKITQVVTKEQPFKEDLPAINKPDVEQKILTQKKAEQKIITRTRSTIHNQAEKHSQTDLPRHISAASLQQQISEQAVATTQQAAAMPQMKTKSVNQVSANKYVAAQYLHDWEAKVAGVGNRNYPEAATKPGFSATLIMEVGINIDGSINNMRITQSSGNPELDEAAKNIVRMSAPFPPLPLALRNELDILKITRVWKFTDESGLVTQ